MARLRHLALHTADPEKTAEFYKRVFDMAEVGQTDSPTAKGIYFPKLSLFQHPAGAVSR